MPLSDGMKVLMSSVKQDWGTPVDLFENINVLFNFDLDVCATEDNKKVDNFISPEMDAFNVQWKGKSCWMNPPYGKPEKQCSVRCNKKKCTDRGFHRVKYLPGVGDWINRAYVQCIENESTVVCLLPARTDANWFQSVWDYASLICFVRGRIKFEGASSGATFPSVIVVFSYHELSDGRYEGMSDFGNVIDPREGQIVVYNGVRK